MTATTPSAPPPPLLRVRRKAQQQQQQGDDSGNLDDFEAFINDNNNNGGCPKCTCDATNTTTPEEETLEMTILVVDSPGIITMVQWNSDDYYEYTNGKVRINMQLADTMPALFAEIERDAKRGSSLYHGYYTNPVILGSASEVGAFADLSPYIQQQPEVADWPDVLSALRQYVTSLEDKIYIVLLDGDTHTLFYRRDVLDHFGLSVPRTWDEYTQVAAAVHGQNFTDPILNTTTTLSGSCVSRIQGDHAMYWYHLVLSTITQVHGTATGSLFDSTDMTPLTGAALAEMLRIHEAHSQFGTDDEYTDIINHVQNNNMYDGKCVMTFMWGDLFRRSRSEGSILHDRLGIAPTPGSTRVLNRQTQQLETCTSKEQCPYADFYKDIGWVNKAPYAANGGWGVAVSANTEVKYQKALAEWALWASSRQQSEQYVIPTSATLPWHQINGQDPFRKSSLEVQKWVDAGFDRELSKQYVESILTNLVSKNVVVEARFPKAGEVMSVLDKRVNEYLVRAVVEQSILEEDKETERLRTADLITSEWNQIIREYDARGDTATPILEVYQRLRGVYVPNEERNYLTTIRPFGYTMLSVVWATALAMGVWVYWKRNASVVKASQPIFLGLILCGTVVLASSMIPMGIDDSVASQRGCDIACMASPWLIAIGFSITFAALASKILRLKILMRNAQAFRRIQVRTKDVMLPLVVTLATNTILLSIWTAVDPLTWVRVDTGRNSEGQLSSYGHCVASGTTTPVILSLLAVTNFAALVFALVLAFQTRELQVAFNESKFVALSMFAIVQAMLIGLPILFLAESNPTTFYVVRCILVFVVCFSVQLFMFVPKMNHSGNEDSSMMNDLRTSMANSNHRRRESGGGGGNSTYSHNASAHFAALAKEAVERMEKDKGECSEVPGESLTSRTPSHYRRKSSSGVSSGEDSESFNGNNVVSFKIDDDVDVEEKKAADSVRSGSRRESSQLESCVEEDDGEDPSVKDAGADASDKRQEQPPHEDQS